MDIFNFCALKSLFSPLMFVRGKNYFDPSTNLKVHLMAENLKVFYKKTIESFFLRELSQDF